jgi:thymidylate synthase
MKAYLDIVKHILANGKMKENRTGMDALTVAGCMFEHDMAKGFPILTTKYVPFQLIASELEFFIQGMTDKTWLHEQNNHIWDEWCSPEIIPYANDEETKKRMAKEKDLGPIYGFQWRNFGGDHKMRYGYYKEYGTDQLKKLVTTLKENPDDRRMIVSAWNPNDIHKMALPPCHYGFQVTVINGELNLAWNQRSVDVALGLPFNIASYALLHQLLCKESGFVPGKLIGFLMDTHIYKNHIEGIREQIGRHPKRLPELQFANFSNIFGWHWKDTHLDNYTHHEHISFDIAV